MPKIVRLLLRGFSVCLAALGCSGPTNSQSDDASTKPAGAAPPGMAWIPGGYFAMGSDAAADSLPIRRVFVDGFWLDRTETTNAEFQKFVEATGYATVAERRPKAEDLPGVAAEDLQPGSIVFSPPAKAVSLDDPYAWWKYVPGANWRRPEGPGTTIVGREEHPVVHVCWEDAAAYAAWAGKRMPTEAEWECAARGGLSEKRYVWGDELKPGGRWPANIWQGRFPIENTAEDGFKGTAPVGSFPPNGYGLFDMAGNVWEWCADWYQPDYYQSGVLRNPPGPTSSFDPNEPNTPKRVQRGGSFLCSEQYCVRYQPGLRGKGDPTSAQNHCGFRCALSAKPKQKLK